MSPLKKSPRRSRTFPRRTPRRGSDRRFARSPDGGRLPPAASRVKHRRVRPARARKGSGVARVGSSLLRERWGATPDPVSLLPRCETSSRGTQTTKFGHQVARFGSQTLKFWVVTSKSRPRTLKSGHETLNLKRRTWRFRNETVRSASGISPRQGVATRQRPGTGRVGRGRGGGPGTTRRIIPRPRLKSRRGRAESRGVAVTQRERRAAAADGRDGAARSPRCPRPTLSPQAREPA